MKKNLLLEEIEQCRTSMMKLALSTSLTNEEVILKSKKLDNLLNYFEEIKQV